MSDRYNTDAFSEWIVAQGGVIQPVTNEWEVLRYKLPPKRVGVLYRNKRDQQTPTEIFGEDYKKFLSDTGLAPSEKIDRARWAEKKKLKSIIAQRDPESCIYCSQFFTEDAPETLEHFHAINRTGNNHEDNLGRACKPCNEVVGSLPVAHKILLRDRIQASVQRLPPWDRFNASKNFSESQK